MNHDEHLRALVRYGYGIEDCRAAGCEGALPEPYYERDGVSLLHGDCRDVLAGLPAESVSCCVTSPPFWGLRKYDCPPSVWGGEPECSHTLDAQPMSEEGYAGRKRWQHDGVSRQETPEAWVKTSGAPDVGRNDADRRSRGGTFVPGEWREEWAGGGKKAKPPEGATCSLCGAWRGWLGLEPTVAMYVEHTIEVLRAIRRVMRPDGCLWWDLDDSRAGGGSGMQGDASYGSTLHGATAGGKRWGHIAHRPKTTSSPKSLCLIPQRVAIAAQEDGWIVRSQIIIPSWMPESARDRPTDAYRVVLMLCKQKAYWYDAAAVRVPCDSRDQGHGDDGHMEYTDLRGHTGPLTGGRTYERHHALDHLRNLGNIWDDIPPSAYPAAHFATFPVEEPERCIKASCPAEVCVNCGKARVRITDNKAMVIARSGRAEAAGCRTLPSGTMLEPPEEKTLGWTDCGCGAGFEPGLILDPFMGTGTTAVAAVKLGRRCIGIDASEEYLKQAVTRLTVGDAGVRRIVAAERAGAKQEVLL